MKKINTNEWKEFVIKKLFEVSRPTARSQVDYDEGDVPFVASGNYNNGVLKYLQPKKDEILDKGNCITVSPIDGSAFYQEVDFLGRGGAGSSIIILRNENLNLYNGMYIATVIRAVCSKYVYNDMANKDTIGSEKIRLPINRDGNPDFLYMESYMKNLCVAVSSSLRMLQSTKEKCNSRKLNSNQWKEFHLYDLFEIDPGTKLDKIKMDTSEAEVCFVGRSNANNGITEHVKKIEGLEPYKAGYLTLALGGAYLGSCFVQEREFYTSQNVVVLIPKEDISFEAKLFIATAIFKESQNNYKAFIKELNAHIKRGFVIQLPVDENGDPNYSYMDMYMKKVRKKTELFISTMSA